VQEPNVRRRTAGRSNLTYSRKNQHGSIKSESKTQPIAAVVELRKVGRSKWEMQMKRALVSVATAMVATFFATIASAQQCNVDNAWRRVRATYPTHVQTIAMCRNASSGSSVIIGHT
jgi:hypothetical protein